MLRPLTNFTGKKRFDPTARSPGRPRATLALAFPGAKGGPWRPRGALHGGPSLAALQPRGQGLCPRLQACPALAPSPVFVDKPPRTPDGSAHAAQCNGVLSTWLRHHG